MKRKVISVIACILCICQLLPVYAGAVDTLDVYPIIYFPRNFDDQTNDNDLRNLAIYQTTSEATTVSYNWEGLENTDRHTGEYGIIFPINNLSNVSGGTETYLINFTMQLKPKERHIGFGDTSLALSKFFINYGLSDESSRVITANSNGVYSFNNSYMQVWYKPIYTPTSDINETDVIYDFGYGVYNLHFTIRLSVDYNSTIRNIFFAIDFDEFGLEYNQLDVIIQPCTTSSYVVSDLDDIDGELDRLNSQISEIYALLDEMNKASVSSGNSTTQILNNILNQDKVGYEEIKQATESVKQQVEEMKDTMDEKVDEGMSSFKDKVEKEAADKADKTVQEILDKVDIVDTGAAENAFTALFNAITTDSMNAVLTVPDFKLDLGDDSYTLWNSFTIDIPELLDQMGIDDFMIVVRFPFYFGFGWFLYGKVNRLIKIMLLDDVNEEQPN